ncbi:MAG: tRNA (adenosine(37)-N6)-threonylcarbamoyltransferase complex dimerization subunit type 1 TsaB [Nitrospirota bacterium]|nr:tRNA (adenosine(37)-N6)-threonylcarbamoyltransferase complex dimerization subunit type 1 TsaB [Nitrospirota bacterium]
MKILGIETSTMLGGVAIADEKGLIAETRLNVKSTHSERLMATIDEQLRQSDMALSDIDVFAVASGPGSFTGLRIGLSTAKGLCYATGKPLVMIPTLEAFARSFPFSQYPVCVMLDARRGEVYAAIFQWDGGFVKLLDEVSVAPEALFKDVDSPVVLAGEGALVYRERLVALLGEQALFAPLVTMVPSPANVAMLGLEKALKGEFTDALAAEPLYIRKSEAEVKWSQKR